MAIAIAATAIQSVPPGSQPPVVGSWCDGTNPPAGASDGSEIIGSASLFPGRESGPATVVIEAPQRR